MDAVHLEIEGMTCGSCVSAATHALRAVPGVASVTVDLEDGFAAVEGSDLAGSVSAMLMALASAGFDARLLEHTAAQVHGTARSGCGGKGKGNGGCCGCH